MSVRAGDRFRLNTRVQEAADGRILATERVEGLGGSSIFSMVDTVTRSIKSSLEIQPVDQFVDRGLLGCIRGARSVIVISGPIDVRP